MAERESESRECSGSGRDEPISHVGNYRIGEHPGIGTYMCTTCRENWTVTIKDKHEELPACEKCGGEKVVYERVSGPEPLGDDLVR
jgi:PHP family Zn ribbon phosphoesterase